ncbi:MAG TPA: SdrD B-like domain-containing protein, partial [Isosphaeraceae bacterium]
VKWNDRNGDGVRNPDEPGVPGVTLHLDYNGNLALDRGEPTAVTDAQGLYRFEWVVPQRYVVREVVPAGWIPTSPRGAGIRIANVTSGQTVSNLNFGNRESLTPVPPPTPGQITGLKWNDRNGDGKRDPDEPGLPGVTIFLDLNSNNTRDDDEPTAVTSADDPATADVNEAGRYRFPDLQPRLYIVREVVPVGSTQTYPGAPAGGSAAAIVVQLTNGQTAADINFGNRSTAEPPREATGEITGIKWRDVNGNGTREPDEPGIGLVAVYLDLNDNGTLDDGEPTARTAMIADAPADVTFREMGRYRFRDLKPGRYVVREVVPEGSTQTFPGATPTGGGPANAHFVELAAGQVDDGYDFGNREISTPPPPPPPGPSPCPEPSAITFRVANQDRCRAKRVELVIDARRVPPGARVALVLPGVDHNGITTYNLRPGSLSPDQLEQPGGPCGATREVGGGRVTIPSVPAYVLIPGSVARITDIAVLPAHAVVAQLVVTEVTAITPGAPFEVRLEQRENGCAVGGVAIGVRTARP